MYIYKITNKINGKSYIGQTIKDIKSRWENHCKKTSNCSAIYNAIQKYGKDNFIVEEIGGANSQSELNYQEWLMIFRYDTLAPNGYNLRQGGGSKGKTHETTKSKLSNINIGKKLKATTKTKIGNTHRGMKRTQKTSNNISVSLRKDKRSIFCINNNTYYNSAAEAGKSLNLDNCSISKVLNNKRNHYKGYKFIYKD